MDVAVPIIAGTAVRGVTATLMMRRVLQRHPNAFLITLASLGVTIPLHRSQQHISDDIRVGLTSKSYSADTPLVLVGHSQGGLAALRYAIDHPDQVWHVISVGAPWHGARSAKRVTGWVERTGLDLTPALNDMVQGSPFLEALHRDLPSIADRVTNIYTTHEILIQPYVDAHIDIPGVTNILIASEQEYARHLRTYPDLFVDDVIAGRVTHLGEMNKPQVRAKIWAKVEEIERGAVN